MRMTWLAIAELIIIALLAALLAAPKLIRRGSPGGEGRERMETLARGLAHEIRNPLNAINAHLQLLQEDISRGIGEERGREYLERIDRIRGEVQRLNRILNDFLRYTRLPKPEPIPLDLSATVNEVLDFIEPESRRLGIEVERRLSPVPLVRADPSQVKQAVLNLILNAHEAMPKGGRMTVSVAPEGRFVKVEVEDTGEGIPEEVIDKIFEPFFSTKREGTGLGLSLVKRIMDEHGGQIRVRSRKGEGTAISLLFPISAG
ncbi:two-component sensor histidine kinase [Candidatus Poribacteria bacterium]|nr:MAG: two-component sensor histidine kinase [Candidatus Poribacteria bacterium]